MYVDHFQSWICSFVFVRWKNTSHRLSDRLTGISLFVALIFSPYPIVLDTIHCTNADSSFLLRFHFKPFFSGCCDCCVALALRYSLLNFVSFVNSNKLSIVLNMCYPRSQYNNAQNTWKKERTAFYGLKYLRAFLNGSQCIHTHTETLNAQQPCLFHCGKMTYGQNKRIHNYPWKIIERFRNWNVLFAFGFSSGSLEEVFVSFCDFFTWKLYFSDWAVFWESYNQETSLRIWPIEVFLLINQKEKPLPRLCVWNSIEKFIKMLETETLLFKFSERTHGTWVFVQFHCISSFLSEQLKWECFFWMKRVNKRRLQYQIMPAQYNQQPWKVLVKHFNRNNTFVPR